MSNPREALTDVLDDYHYLKDDPELVHFFMLGMQLNGKDNIANCLANTIGGRLLSFKQFKKAYHPHRGSPSAWQAYLESIDYLSLADSPKPLVIDALLHEKRRRQQILERSKSLGARTVGIIVEPSLELALERGNRQRIQRRDRPTYLIPKNEVLVEQFQAFQNSPVDMEEGWRHLYLVPAI